MPSIGEHVERERKPKLGGGGPGKIPHRHGYGGGGDDGDHSNFHDPFSREQRLRRYRVGMFLCIVSVSTLFIGLMGAYLWRLSMGRYDPGVREFISDWRPLHLPYLQLWINSGLLLLSSITLELARRRMEKHSEFYVLGIAPPHSRTDLPWLGLTLFLGVGFVCGQIMVWNGFWHQGLFLRSNPSSSFFYILTGMHAVHLIGGLMALLFAVSARWIRRTFQSRQLNLEVTGWYWHFMGILWFAIFGMLHFAPRMAGLN